MKNNESPVILDFPQSVAHNLEWIKQLAIQHDVSAVLAAHAALMTMTMMDHHKMWTALERLQADIDQIKATLCQSSS
jgi:hypothetical protein